MAPRSRFLPSPSDMDVMSSQLTDSIRQFVAAAEEKGDAKH